MSSKKVLPKFSFQEIFFSDLMQAGMLSAVIVRSPVQKGMIKSVSHPNLPDGYSLFTARDVPGKNLIETSMGSIPIFSEGNVSYMGEPLGILVGPDESVLEQLLEEIDIVFDSSPIESYLDFLEKVEDSPETSEIKDIFSVKVAERKIKCGPCFEPDSEGNVPGIKSAFENSKFVISNCWTYNLSIPYYNEPNGALCSFDKEGNLTIHTPTQWISSLRKILSEALHIKSDQINIKKTNSYDRRTNSVWYNSIIACQVAVASFRTGKPVKLVYSRKEQNRYIDTMQPITITHKTGMDESGHITAMQIDIDIDSGSTNPFAQEILDRLVIASYGCYTPKNLDISASAHSSQNPSSSIDMQTIDSAAFFALENQINELSSISEYSPLEIRLINFKDNPLNKKIDYLPFSFTLSEMTNTLNLLIKNNDYPRRYASYHLDAILRKQRKEFAVTRPLFESPLRGIGLATAFEGSCYYGSEVYGNDQSIELTLEENGSLTIHCPPISNSIQDIWKKIVSSTLNISLGNIKINSLFEANKELPLPESVYSNISVMTQLLIKACDSIKKRKPESNLPYSVKKKISQKSKSSWDQKEFYGSPFHSTAFAAATVEVELDLCSYRENIKAINIIVNAGKILNPIAAESTIKLEVHRLLENLVKDCSIECENLHVYLMQSDKNPMQIGELVYQVIPAAYTQAVSQALSYTMTNIPITSDSIYNKLEEQRSIEAIREINLGELKNEDTGNT